MPEENNSEEQADEDFDGTSEEDSTSEESYQPEEDEFSDEDTSQEVEIDGKKYTQQELQEALQAKEDYNYLLPEFTRRSQKLAELEKNVSQIQQQPNVPEDQKVEETKKLLREQFGVVTKEDLEQVLSGLEASRQAETQLQQTVGDLGKLYSGEHGEPKFNYNEVKDYLTSQYGDNPGDWPDKIDLEAAYLSLHRDFFSRIPKVKSTVAQTERRSSTPFSLEKKKIKFDPAGKDEMSAEDAAREIIAQSKVK